MGSESSIELVAPALLHALRASTSGRRFSTSTFFAEWFITGPQRLFFLFRKNLGVTNIQYCELLGLLRQFSTYKDSGMHVEEMSFTSPSEFKASIGELIQELIEGASNPDSALELAVDLYTPLVKSLAVVRPFYGSCVAYIPPNIDVDLVSVCGMSGYIHSCGPAVYVRRFDKAKKREFFAALDSYLKRYEKAGRRVLFAPYAHEDFSEFDKEKGHVREDLIHGLDDVKLHIEKMNMGNTRLVAVLEDMRKDFGDRLTIPPPGDYRVNHPALAKNTLWLIGDNSVDRREPSKPGELRYFISYDQLYYNDSPFFIFDENKPAWTSHTTIPHTLMAAMLNVARPWSRGQPFDFADPFVGTGTTFFEAAKDVSATGFIGDLNAVSELVVGDNIEFFGLSPLELGEVLGALEALTEHASVAQLEERVSSAPELFPGPLSAYQWARTLLDSIRPRQPNLDQEVSFSTQAISLMKSAALSYRIVFYVMLRAWNRNQGALYRGSMRWAEAFQKAGKELLGEIMDFDEWVKRAQTETHRTGHMGVFAGKYSDRCAISVERLRDLSRKRKHSFAKFQVRDARELEENAYDLIVTDPPYGYNTDEEIADMARLYRAVIRALVRSLRDDGQLIISLPEKSKTGRPIPFFTRVGAVVPEILAAAREVGLIPVTRSQTLPDPRAVFSPPYYWQSERALTRTVLHFRFHRRQEVSDVNARKFVSAKAVWQD